jgi:hypothetical protein
MPSYHVHDSGVAKARELIASHQYVLDSRWSDAQPSADDENANLERDGWEGYGRWHLAIDDDASPETKQRYGFVFGDFRRVHRSALVACSAPRRTTTAASSRRPATCWSCSTTCVPADEGRRSSRR